MKMLKGILFEKNNELYIQYNPKKIYGYVGEQEIKRTFYISEIKVNKEDVTDKKVGDEVVFIIIEKDSLKQIKIVE
jgi:hypothetical protein